MDPEQEIAAYLRSKGVQRAVLNDMLRGFAHDLAEAQRAAIRENDEIGREALVDLIDPEVTDAQ